MSCRRVLEKIVSWLGGHSLAPGGVESEKLHIGSRPPTHSHEVIQPPPPGVGASGGGVGC